MYYNKEILELFINTVKDYCSYIEICGSSLIPYIKNPRDFDISIVVNSIENRAIVFKKMHEFNKIYGNLKFKHNICVKVRTTLNKDQKLAPYNYITCYQQHWLKLLYGNFTDKFFYDYDEQLLVYPELWYNHCQDRFKKAYKAWLWSPNKNTKIFYHFYINMCILQNKSYDLTETQITKLNIIHDISEGYIDIINELKNFYNYTEEN